MGFVGKILGTGGLAMALALSAVPSWAGAKQAVAFEPLTISLPKGFAVKGGGAVTSSTSSLTIQLPPSATAIDDIDQVADQIFPGRFHLGRAARAFSGASYLDRRYGWRLGLPSYALASLVAFHRAQPGGQPGADILTGAAFAWGFDRLIGPPPVDGMRFNATARRQGGFLRFSFKW